MRKKDVEAKEEVVYEDVYEHVHFFVLNSS